MGIFSGQQCCPQAVQHEAMDIDVPQFFRRNCKRSWDYEPCDVEPKRFRRETGNGHIHYETENTKTYTMDQMQDPPSSVYLSTTGHNYHSYFLPVDKSSSISDSGCKYISSSNNSKSNKSDAEYERMLFETHGCTVYHHQRTQLLDNDHIETEF
ncbi:uncharacterized protein LOC105188276 [Harpegnathos saltator]|uniref:uncharacterized protein LOC105188276 n=1 Tax=Harpegnathos saltator TaxID=610380 RepID=UPI00058B7619|nr:uncharacterized protein LOC105188276 [Harpegnathos saltator]